MLIATNYMSESLTVIVANCMSESYLWRVPYYMSESFEKIVSRRKNEPHNVIKTKVLSES